MFSFVVPDLTKSDFKKIDEHFFKGIEVALWSIRVTKEESFNLINQIPRQMIFTKTVDKKILGYMNEMKHYYEDFLFCEGDPVDKAIYDVNRILLLRDAKTPLDGIYQLISDLSYKNKQ